MQIRISGQQVSIGQSLQTYVEETLTGAVEKYFDRAIGADVVFTKENHLFVTTISVNEGVRDGIFIRSEASEDEIYASFDRACERIEKQLRRYKRRIKNHHKQKQSEIVAEELISGAMKYVISEKEENEEVAEESAPLIIAEKQTAIERLTVSDAVMRMNLANLPALMFINKQTDHICVVYHRKDGNISWVDSKLEAAATSTQKNSKAA